MLADLSRNLAHVVAIIGIAAEAQGLGIAWISSVLYIKDELKEILEKAGVKWKEPWEPRTILPFGYPNKTIKKPPRRPLDTISQTI